MRQRVQLYITGNVQRVGFRHQAAEMAIAFDINGRAMYMDDGLLIEAEGEADQVTHFVNWCRKGPENCMISSFSIKEMPLIHYPEFEIIHGVVSSESVVDFIAS